MSQKKGQKQSSHTCDALYERAYIYYRRNQNTEALAELARGNQNELRFMELKAQLYYRMERTQEALDLLKKIMELHSDDNDDARRSNYIAALVQLRSKNAGGQNTEIPFEPTTFEQLYNLACQLAAGEQYAEAIALLDKTINECKETLTEDGLTAEEMEEELAIIVAQKAFCLQKLGRKEEALTLYNGLQKVGDNNVKAVVFNNRLSVEDNPSLAEARKELRTISKTNKSKLISGQRQCILLNMVIPIKTTALLQLYPSQKEGETGEFQEIFSTRRTTRKRRRKTILPKNYDPNGPPPDPERWLPRHERSTHKRKLNKKFKDKEIGRGTQGSATAANQQTTSNIDYSKSSSTEPASPKSTPPARSAQPKGAKKKKGGRW